MPRQKNTLVSAQDYEPDDVVLDFLETHRGLSQVFLLAKVLVSGLKQQHQKIDMISLSLMFPFSFNSTHNQLLSYCGQTISRPVQTVSFDRSINVKP
jgi:hypothetical protein